MARVRSAAFVVFVAGTVAGLGGPSALGQTWAGGNGDWTDPANWFGGIAPNSSVADVLIDGNPGGSSSVRLDQIRAARDVTIDELDELRIVGAGRLDLHRNISNHGTLRLRDGGVVRLSGGNSTVSGSGRVVFDSAALSSFETGFGSWALTIGADQQVTTSAGAAGALNVNTVVDGDVFADGGAITFGSSRSVTSNGMLRAASGGRLIFGGSNTVTNNSVIETLAGGTVEFNSTTLNGGTVRGAGAVELNGSHTFSNVTLDVDSFVIDGGNTLNLGGTLTNEGRMSLQDVAGGPASLRLSAGSQAIEGSGEIVFGTIGTNAFTTGFGSWQLTIGESQTVRTLATGRGSFEVNSRIEGVVEASGGEIRFGQSRSVDNRDSVALRATGGGNLAFLGTNTVDNTGSVISADAASTVSLFSTTLTGGSVAGGGTLELSGSHTFDGVTLDIAGVNLDGNNVVNLTGGLTNNTSIVMGADSGNSSQLRLSAGSVAIGGAGEVVFDSADTTAFTTGFGSWEVTLGADQVARTTAGSTGIFDVNTVVDGSVLASDGVITFTSSRSVTNNGAMAATGSGEISFASSNTVTNNGSLSAADAGSQLSLNGTTLNGGTLSGDGRLRFAGSNAFSGVTLDIADVLLSDGATINVTNGLTNNTDFVFGDGSADGVAEIRLSAGSQAIGGVGSFRFDSDGSNQFTTAFGSWAFTFGADQEVRATAGSSGEFNANTVVNGSVVSDGGTISYQSNRSVANDGSIGAINGGVVTFGGANSLSGSGVFEADASSMIVANAATLNNVLFAGDGELELAGASTLNSGRFDIAETRLIAGATLGFTGQLDLNGVLRLVGDESSSAAVRLTGGGVSVIGAGEILFDSAGSNVLGTNFGTWGYTLGEGVGVRVGSGNSGTFGAIVSSSGMFDIDGVLRVEAGRTLTLTSTAHLGGTGVLDVDQSAAVLNNSGTIAPGGSTGTFTIEGSVNNLAGSVLDVEIGGLIEGVNSDLLVVTGVFDTTDVLRVTFVGMAESLGETDSVRIVNAGDLGGPLSFASIELGGESEGLFDVRFDAASGSIFLENFRDVVVPGPGVMSVFGVVGVLASRRRRSR